MLALVATTVAISHIVVLESFHCHAEATGIVASGTHTCFLCQVAPGIEPPALADAPCIEPPRIEIPSSDTHGISPAPDLDAAPARAPPA